MKKFKRVIASVLMISLSVSLLSGCAASDVKKASEEFLKAALELDFDSMAELCEDEDEAIDLLDGLQCPDFVEALIDKATSEVGKIKGKKNEYSAEIKISIPDYEAILDEEPDDLENFIDMIDEYDSKDTYDFDLTLDFEKDKKDGWLLVNLEDFISDFYDELNDIDLPFASPYISYLSDSYWWSGENNTGNHNNAYCLEYDMIPDSDNTNTEFVYYFLLYNEGGTNLILDSREVQGGMTTDYGIYLECYCYYDDCSIYDSSYSYFPAGTYLIEVYDSNDSFIVSAEAYVTNTYD